MTIFAPASARSVAIGRPMLRIRPAPVTMATFPCSSRSMASPPSRPNDTWSGAAVEGAASAGSVLADWRAALREVDRQQRELLEDGDRVGGASWPAAAVHIRGGEAVHGDGQPCLRLEEREDVVEVC